MPIVDLEYNLEEVSSDFPVLPGGTYLAELDKAELVNAQSSGKPMIKVTWKVMDGEFVGRLLWDNVPLHVPFKVKQYAEAMGVTSGSQLDTDAMKGATAVLEVIQAENDQKPGEYQNKIKKITRS